MVRSPAPRTHSRTRARARSNTRRPRRGTRRPPPPSRFASTPPRPRARARPAPQIRFFLLQNRQGKTRLSKWYVAIEEPEKRKIENEVHRLVTARDNKFTNFVEVRRDG